MQVNQNEKGFTREKDNNRHFVPSDFSRMST